VAEADSQLTFLIGGQAAERGPLRAVREGGVALAQAGGTREPVEQQQAGVGVGIDVLAVALGIAGGRARRDLRARLGQFAGGAGTLKGGGAGMLEGRAGGMVSPYWARGATTSRPPDTPAARSFLGPDFNKTGLYAIRPYPSPRPSYPENYMALQGQAGGPPALPVVPGLLRANDNSQSRPCPVVRSISAPPPCFGYDMDGPDRHVFR